MLAVIEKDAEEKEPLNQSGLKNETEKQAGHWGFCIQPGTGTAEVLGRRTETASQRAQALA